MSEKVVLSLDMPPQFEERLHDLASKMKASEGDVLQKAVALMEFAYNAQARGEAVGATKNKQDLTTVITGI